MEESFGVPSEEEVEEITEKPNVLGSSSGWEDTGNHWCGRDSKPHCVDLRASLEGRSSPWASWWVSTTWSHPRMFCISTLLPCILHITMCSAPDFLMGSEGPSCTEPSTECSNNGLDEWTKKESVDSDRACPEVSVDGFHSLACLETLVTPFLSCDYLSPTEANSPLSSRVKK